MAWEHLTGEVKEPSRVPPEMRKQREEFARLHTVVFGGGAGADLLKRYHELIVDKVLPDDASGSALVGLNALRKFVRDLERLTAEGRETKAQ